VVVDTILRLLPGAIDAESTAEESFTAGLLEYPQYTRPPVFRDLAVPAVLTSGHHEAVRKWRLKEIPAPHLAPRPELLEDRPMSREEPSCWRRSATRRASPPPMRQRQTRRRRRLRKRQAAWSKTPTARLVERDDRGRQP